MVTVLTQTGILLGISWKADFVRVCHGVLWELVYRWLVVRG